jgi:hypothetical protein
MTDNIGVAQEFIPTVVDLADDSTVVFKGPCLLRGVYVNTAMSAQDVPIKLADGTTKFKVPASSPAGAPFHMFDANMNGITVDPDDAATGEIVVVWKPFSTEHQEPSA